MKLRTLVLANLALAAGLTAQQASAQSLQALTQQGYNTELAAQAVNLTPMPDMSNVSVIPADETQLLSAINAIRQQNGLPAFTNDTALGQAARYEVLSEHFYQYSGNFGMLADGTTRVYPAAIAGAFQSLPSGVLSVQGTNESLVSATSNWQRQVSNWYAGSVLFRRMVDSSSYTRAGIGLINSGYTISEGGNTFPVLYWTFMAGTGSAPAPVPAPAPAPVVTPPAPVAPSVGAVTASPATVTGETTTLAAQAQDPQNEALTYSWAASGPAPVTFSANNNSSAGTVTATFSQAGSYTFTVTTTDTSGLSSRGQVQATVTPTLTTLSVSPGSVSLSVGQTQSYTASGTDQFGTAMNASPSWSVGGGGTIDSASYTASTPGGPFPVTATSGTVSATAQVIVVPAVQLHAPLPNLVDLLSGQGYNTELAAQAVNLTPMPDMSNVSVIPADETQLLSAINAIRQQNGLPAFTNDTALGQAARYEVLSEHFYQYSGNFGMLADGTTRVYPAAIAGAFQSLPSGVLSVQGTNESLVSATSNWQRQVSNWYAGSVLFRRMVDSSSYTRAGIGLINSGYTISEGGRTFPVLYWTFMAGQ